MSKEDSPQFCFSLNSAFCLLGLPKSEARQNFFFKVSTFKKPIG